MVVWNRLFDTQKAGRKKSEEELKAEEERKKRNEEIKQQYMRAQREKQEAMAAQVCTDTLVYQIFSSRTPNLYKSGAHWEEQGFCRHSNFDKF